jgi:Cache domain
MMFKEPQLRSKLSHILLLVAIVMLFVFIPTTNIYSQKNDTQFNSDISLNLNITKSEQLENLGLYAIYHQLEMEISRIMNIAHESMNLTNSFGNFTVVNLTTDMQQQYRGIPSDQDVEKRNEAKNLLANNPHLLFIGMNFPNGDTYFSEPFYPSQANSSVYNYGHRDHIIGALESKQPYLSNVISAASTGKPIAVLSAPIFSDNAINNTLLGMLALGLNFTHFNEMIKSESSGNNDTRTLLVDNNGTEIADSISNNNKSESFNGLQSFKNAKDGELGSVMENINGNNMTISYAPIDFAQTKWILISISPNK